MPQDPILTERHTQEGRQTTKKGGTEEPNRFRKELVDEPVVATTNGDAGHIEGGVTKTRSGPSLLAPTLLPVEKTHRETAATKQLKTHVT